MEEKNIYEELGISIYCTYRELIAQYSKYCGEHRKEKRKEMIAVNALASRSDGIIRAKQLLEKNGLKMYRTNMSTLYTQCGITSKEDIELLEEIYRKMVLIDSKHQQGIAEMNAIMKKYELDQFPKGTQAKAVYDQTHKTDYAILGMPNTPYVVHIPKSAEIKQLQVRYPEHEKEIRDAYNHVMAIELRKQRRLQKERKEEKNEIKNVQEGKMGFMAKVKRAMIPVFLALGITAAIPKLLPEGNIGETATTPTPQPTENKRSEFVDSIKIGESNVTFEEDGMQINVQQGAQTETEATQASHTPTSQMRTISMKNVLESQNTANTSQQSFTQQVETPTHTPTPTTVPIILTDPMASFKAKMQNDSELNDIVTQALSSVSVDENYDASNSEKIDYILGQIASQNVDTVLNPYIDTRGIKNQIVHLVEDVVIYYIEQETGQNGLFIRYEEDIVKEGLFSVIDKSGRNYVATTDMSVGNLKDTLRGTRYTINPSVAFMVEEAKKIQVRDFREDDYDIGQKMQILNHIMLKLNELGDEQIIVSRNRQQTEER